MREKDNGEKLLDMLASMSLSYDTADDAYQLAGEVVCELDDVKEENIALKKHVADLEAQAAVGARAVWLLKEIEWADIVRKGDDSCPCCARGLEHGHADDCKLDAILRDAAKQNGGE